MSRALISASELSLSYGRDAPLFKPLSFQVWPGQALCLRGPNGVGKTSLFRCLVHSISVKIHGQLETNLKLFELQYLPQHLSPKLILPLSCEEITRLHAAQDSALVNSKMKALLWNEMSGGERKRLLLACLLAQKPKLLLCDEPFDQLDSESRHDACKALADYQANGGALILSDHSETYRSLDALQEISLSYGDKP